MPFPYKRILCPVDFDDYSAEALKEAVALALSGGGTVQVLHVVQRNPLDDSAATGGVAVGELYDYQADIARKQVEQMLTSMPAEVKCEVLIEVGEPGNSILDAQITAGADLVVMATHGRKGLKHLVLGSVAERIVRESRVPVLTVRPTLHKQQE